MIRHGGPVETLGEPAWVVGTEVVRMPKPEQFFTAQDYYATRFHEWTHWTAPKVERELKIQHWGDQGYALEELVAELGAAFLCAHLGVSPNGPRADHASYLAHWLGALKAQPELLYQVSSAAEKACAYLIKLGGAELQAEDSEEAAA